MRDCTYCGGIGCADCDLTIHLRECEDDDCKCQRLLREIDPAPWEVRD